MKKIEATEDAVRIEQAGNHWTITVNLDGSLVVSLDNEGFQAVQITPRAGNLIDLNPTRHA